MLDPLTRRLRDEIKMKAFLFFFFQAANFVVGNSFLLPLPQNAGNQLKSLQKALKNPLGNAGLLAGELSKRAKRFPLPTHSVCNCSV